MGGALTAELPLNLGKHLQGPRVGHAASKHLGHIAILVQMALDLDQRIFNLGVQFVAARRADQSSSGCDRLGDRLGAGLRTSAQGVCAGCVASPRGR